MLSLELLGQWTNAVECDDFILMLLFFSVEGGIGRRGKLKKLLLRFAFLRSRLVVFILHSHV